MTTIPVTELRHGARLAGKLPLSPTAFGAVIALSLSAGAQAQTLTYTYNALGRLTDVSSSAGPAVEYAYDSAGNRVVTETTVPPELRGSANETPSPSSRPAAPNSHQAPVKAAPASPAPTKR